MFAGSRKIQRRAENSPTTADGAFPAAAGVLSGGGVVFVPVSHEEDNRLGCFDKFLQSLFSILIFLFSQYQSLTPLNLTKTLIRGCFTNLQRSWFSSWTFPTRNGERGKNGLPKERKLQTKMRLWLHTKIVWIFTTRTWLLHANNKGISFSFFNIRWSYMRVFSPLNKKTKP